MKQKRYIYGIVGCLLISMMLGISSCDGLEDELFQKNSYIVHNGWQDYALEVAEDNTTILPIYFGVNGTSANDKDICLTMIHYRNIIGRNIKISRTYTIRYCRQVLIHLMQTHGLFRVGS